MKINKRIAALLTLAALLGTATDATAQFRRGRGSGGWGPDSVYGRKYDTNTVRQFRGEITAVESFVPAKRMGRGVHLKVKADKEILAVHLGPQWYLDKQDTQLVKGDKVEIKGSRITLDGKPVIIAAEVRKGDHVLKLRDETGFPSWAGWRRR